MQFGYRIQGIRCSSAQHAIDKYSCCRGLRIPDCRNVMPSRIEIGDVGNRDCIIGVAFIRIVLGKRKIELLVPDIEDPLVVVIFIRSPQPGNVLNLSRLRPWVNPRFEGYCGIEIIEFIRGIDVHILRAFAMGDSNGDCIANTLSDLITARWVLRPCRQCVQQKKERAHWEA